MLLDIFVLENVPNYATVDGDDGDRCVRRLAFRFLYLFDYIYI